MEAFRPIQPLLPIHYKPYGELLPMSTTPADLQLEVTSVPHGAKPVMRRSVDIVLEVLNNLGMSGSWDVAFVRQHTKKCNIKFQFVRQDPVDDRTLHVRVKCGGKSSCWNIALHVPDRHDPTKVIEDFKKIHPRNLKVQRRRQPEQPVKPTVPVVRVEETKPKTTPVKTTPVPPTESKPVPLLHIGSRVVWEYAVETLEKSNSAIDAIVLGYSLVAERANMTDEQWGEWLARNNIPPLKDACLQTLASEVAAMKRMNDEWRYDEHFEGMTVMEAFEQFNIDPSKPTPLPPREEKPAPTPEPPQPVQDDPLRLNPTLHKDLVHNQDVLDMGLLALQPYFDGNGTIERVPAIDVLIDKLHMLDYIRQQDYYKDARRATSQILRGLANYQFLTRWTYGEGKGRKSPTTRAFILTPKGRERLASLHAPISVPEPAHRPTLATETVEPSTEPAQPNGNLMATVEAQAEALKPLMDEHDGLNEDIDAYEEFLDDNQRQQQENDATRTKIKTQIEELKQEQQRLAKLMADAEKQRAAAEQKAQTLQKEQESYSREKKETVEKVAALKARIRSILYPEEDQRKSELGA